MWSRRAPKILVWMTPARDSLEPESWLPLWITRDLAARKERRQARLGKSPGTNGNHSRHASWGVLTFTGDSRIVYIRFTYPLYSARRPGFGHARSCRICIATSRSIRTSKGLTKNETFDLDCDAARGLLARSGPARGCPGREVAERHGAEDRGNPAADAEETGGLGRGEERPGRALPRGEEPGRLPREDQEF